jgi:hypothetical protein
MYLHTYYLQVWPRRNLRKIFVIISPLLNPLHNGRCNNLTCNLHVYSHIFYLRLQRSIYLKHDFCVALCCMTAFDTLGIDPYFVGCWRMTWCDTKIMFRVNRS